MLSATTLFPPPVPVDDGEGRARVDAYGYPVSLRDMLFARLPRLIVTPAILAVIAGVFVAMVASSHEISFSSATLDRWGAQVGPRIALGEWWRLLTAMWLHGNVLHLGLNSLFLWRLGSYVERLLGPLAFLIVYVLAGVVASIVSLQFHVDGLSVGASGAIFGLVGVLLMVAMTSRGRGGILGDMLAELRPNLVSVVVANLMLGYLVPGVDNAAHVGGLGGGLALGWLVGRHSLEATPSLRVTLIPIVVTAGLLAAAVVAVGWRDDVRTQVAIFGSQIDDAEAAYRQARRDIDAGRRSAGDVAADVERTVFPFVQEAQQRAETLGGTSSASTLELAWKRCLAEYRYAWQLRVAGLRGGDTNRLAEGDARARIAIHNLSSALARH